MAHGVKITTFSQPPPGNTLPYIIVNSCMNALHDNTQAMWEQNLHALPCTSPTGSFMHVSKLQRKILSNLDFKPTHAPLMPEAIASTLKKRINLVPCNLVHATRNFHADNRERKAHVSQYMSSSLLSPPRAPALFRWLLPFSGAGLPVGLSMPLPRQPLLAISPT